MKFSFGLTPQGKRQIDDYKITPPKTHNQIGKAAAANEKQDKLSKPVVKAIPFELPMLKFKQEAAPKAVERIRETVRQAPPFTKPPVIRRVRMVMKRKIKKQDKCSGKIKNATTEKEPRKGGTTAHSELKKSFKCRKSRAYHQAEKEALKKGKSPKAAKQLAQLAYKKEADACERDWAARGDDTDID